MVDFCEVGGGYGGVAAENGEILSLFSSPGNCQASFVSLSLSLFFFFNFLISLCLSLSLLSIGKNTYTLTAVVAHVKIYTCLIFRKRTGPT
jgi:hypothetical protein